MRISINNLSFGFTKEMLFRNLSIEIEGGIRPFIILGPSGSGKTTFLKLLAGLLKPESGKIIFSEEGKNYGEIEVNTGFLFQEPRLLPWLTVLENVSLPLRKVLGDKEAEDRGKHYLSLVSLSGKEKALPAELSGGQAQRVSMARAFAWPAHILLMDEPFQSLDIPLRLDLMDLSLSLMEKEKRFLIAVTHDPREAVYMGGRVVILRNPGEGFIFDKIFELSKSEREYGSAANAERELIEVLKLSKSK
ncbi:MAG: ATP-binding cassette domain-containing protein [Treponema sp.]|nr:ATP-binding cassette domain-containing protein [Treponema sp.]